jgi:hypothetical protein
MKIGVLERLNMGIGIHCNDGTGDGGGSGGDAGDGGSSEGAGDAGASDGGQGSAISSGSDLPLHEAMPEKFRVFEGEGDEAKFNLEGSAKKLLDSYSALEKRGGAPESPDDYNVDGSNIAEGFDFAEFKKDDTNKAFLKSMHAAGLNNGQVQKVLEYGMKELIPGLVGGNEVLNQEQAIEHMKTEVWKDGNQYAENMGMANRAYTSLPEDLQQKVNERIGNDPTFLQVMALFGKEMREDTPPDETAGMGEGADIEKLMMSDAYKDPKNPDHEKVSRQVKAYFEKKHPARAS